MTLKTTRWTPLTHEATWFEIEWDTDDEAHRVIIDGMVAGQESTDLAGDYARILAENIAMSAAQADDDRQAEIAALQAQIADAQARLAELEAE